MSKNEENLFPNVSVYQEKNNRKEVTDLRRQKKKFFNLHNSFYNESNLVTILIDVKNFWDEELWYIFIFELAFSSWLWYSKIFKTLLIDVFLRWGMIIIRYLSIWMSILIFIVILNTFNYLIDDKKIWDAWSIDLFFYSLSTHCKLKLKHIDSKNNIFLWVILH